MAIFSKILCEFLLNLFKAYFNEHWAIGGRKKYDMATLFCEERKLTLFIVLKKSFKCVDVHRQWY